MESTKDVRARLREMGDPETAAFLQGFFQTQPGGYGEGDRFLGIRVPAVRKLVRGLRAAPLDDVLELLRSPWHEERLLALFALVDAFERGDEDTRAAIYRAYLEHAAYVNNWDLVDGSAPQIVGGHLRGRDLSRLDTLAASNSVWERRIAMLATFHFIRHGEVDAALRMAERLRDDPHDLIHKAVGWMLREAEKRDPAAVTAFLDRHAATMPRTMLRYAIERLPEARRRAYLALGRPPRKNAGPPERRPGAESSDRKAGQQG